MRGNVLTIVKKEFARFFGDRRLVFMTLFLPGILIYVMYSFMGTVFDDMFTADDTPPIVYVVNMSNEVEPLLQPFGFEDTIHAELNEVDSIKDRIMQREIDLLVVFPQDFDALTRDFVQRPVGVPAPNVEMFFNSVEMNSLDAFQRMSALLTTYHSSLANVFDINRGNEVGADLATDEEVAAGFIAMLMPLLLLVFLYQGCVGLAPESIAGEKERGTIATLLVTPLKRRELALGKILSLAVLSFLSGAITAVATILSLPNMMGFGGDGMMAVNIYSVMDYVLLMGVILSTVLLLTAAISLISAYSKTVKEAGTAATPLMIVVMLAGLVGMIGAAFPQGIFIFMIPLLNSAQSMGGIFAMDYSIVNVVVTIVSNVVYAGLGAFVLTKMFNSEKVMFSK
jgi:sodium transport system permease protein